MTVLGDGTRTAPKFADIGLAGTDVWHRKTVETLCTMPRTV